MMKEVRPAFESHDEFITSCGGIQPEPLLPLSEEDAHFYDSTLAGNERIEEVIHLFYQNQRPELFTAICLAIRERMDEDGHFIFPADISEDEEGNQVFHFKTLDFEIGPALVAFTSMEAHQKAPPSAAVSQFIGIMLEALMQTNGIHGLLLNPWGDIIYLAKEDIGMILKPGSERFI